jgi:hypothetical protein
VFEVTVRVAVPDGPVLVGLIVAVNPLVAEIVRATVPLNPLMPWIVIVDVPKAPAGMIRLKGLAVMVKSGGEGGMTVTEAVAVCDSVPLVPVTTTE